MTDVMSKHHGGDVCDEMPRHLLLYQVTVSLSRLLKGGNILSF